MIYLLWISRNFYIPTKFDFTKKKFTLEFFHQITSLFFNKRHGKSGLLLPHLKEVKLFVKLARLSGKKSNLWGNWSVWKWVKLYQRELAKFKNTWIFVIMLLASPGNIFWFHGKKKNFIFNILISRKIFYFYLQDVTRAYLSEWKTRPCIDGMLQSIGSYWYHFGFQFSGKWRDIFYTKRKKSFEKSFYGSVSYCPAIMDIVEPKRKRCCWADTQNSSADSFENF